jgi:hypothetical protein
VRSFRFSSTAGRVNSVKDLTFGGSQTKIGTALDGVRDELAGLPVAGVVLVTDGADTSEASLTNTLLNLKAEKAAGVHRRRRQREAAARHADRSRQHAAHGAEGRVAAGRCRHHAKRVRGADQSRSDVEDDGRIVGSQKVQLPADGSPATVRVRATASEPGPRMFSFKVAPQDGEVVTQNNVRSSLIDVRDTRAKILYFEGEPRSEMKFLRRGGRRRQEPADRHAQRTADNKFLRSTWTRLTSCSAGFQRRATNCSRSGA